MSESIEMIPPATALINGIRAIGYSFPTAVADLIDNSITANAKHIHLFGDPLEKEPYFLVFDDGDGMNQDELMNAMQFGSDREGRIDCEADLGRFGLGLKSASLSQCKKFIVISKRYGRIHAMSYDVDIIEKANKWEVQKLSTDEIQNEPFVKELNNLDSGTIVIWKKFDKLRQESGENFDVSFRDTFAETKKHIEYVFHRFYDSVELFVSKKRIEKRDPFLNTSIKGQHGRPVKIPYNGSEITIIPHTLPYANSLSQNEKALLGNPKSIYDEQGFYIYRNKRLIYWGNWMRMGYKSELNKLARIQVDFPSALDSMWMLDVKKSSAKIPDVIKDRIRSAIEDSTIKSKRVIRYRGDKENKSNCPIWNRIKDRDGFVRYEINRENPLFAFLNENLGTQENKILETLLSQIEAYLPKGRIQNDNADSINIVNSGDDVEEESLIQQAIGFASLFPVAQREIQLSKLLGSEGFSKIANKKEEILKRVEG